MAASVALASVRWLRHFDVRLIGNSTHVFHLSVFGERHMMVLSPRVNRASAGLTLIIGLAVVDKEPSGIAARENRKSDVRAIGFGFVVSARPVRLPEADSRP